MAARIAYCCCGALRVETEGEPSFVIACHCRESQRRTGAPFAVGAFADPSFPAPVRSVWEEVRHPWVAFAHDPEHLPQQARSPSPEPLTVA
jgi:hypothetical protein